MGPHLVDSQDTWNFFSLSLCPVQYIAQEIVVEQACPFENLLVTVVILFEGSQKLVP